MSLYNIQLKAMYNKYNSLYGKFIKRNRKKCQYWRNAAGNRWVKVADRLSDSQFMLTLNNIYEIKTPDNIDELRAAALKALSDD